MNILNIINKIIVLILILYVINYLTNGKLNKILTNVTNNCKKNIENFKNLIYDNKIFSTTPKIPFIEQNDFAYKLNNTNNLFTDETYLLYNFMNSLIKGNLPIFELTNSNTTRLLADQSFTDDIISYINKILNTDKFIFSDINLLNNIYYYKNPGGKYVEIFKFSTNITLNNKLIGNFIFAIELFINENKYQNNLNNLTKYQYSNGLTFNCIKNEVINILSIKLLGKSNINEEVINYKNEIFDDLFIKPGISNNDTENSLIPSMINISYSYDEN
jgi:hypothetical protein